MCLNGYLRWWCLLPLSWLWLLQTWVYVTVVCWNAACEVGSSVCWLRELGDGRDEDEGGDFEVEIADILLCTHSFATWYSQRFEILTKSWYFPSLSFFFFSFLFSFLSFAFLSFFLFFSFPFSLLLLYLFLLGLALTADGISKPRSAALHTQTLVS
ncbi:hypothetical protein BDZ91DRAFT_145868 [Kalaharituber pfeilii]|nr:hypothetical protein BDZ91DRAFT_145868 [Kalaharituber pfeilii]